MTTITCKRINEDKEVDERVRGILLYAFALAGGQMPEYCGIEKLIDHKGILKVYWGGSLGFANYHNFIDRAWLEYANEQQIVHYIIINDVEYFLGGENIWHSPEYKSF